MGKPTSVDPNGFILLWRKSFNSVVWQNANLWRYWTWALMKATHKKRTITIGYEKIEIQPGQFVTGRMAAARETGLSQRQIRTCMFKLVKYGKVTIKATNRYSIVTIVNWAAYQNSQKQSDQQSDQQATSKRPANDHKQQCNNGNNVNKTYIADDFTLTKKLVEYAIDKDVDPDKIDELRISFIDYYINKRSKLIDWGPAWQGWVRRAPEYSKWAMIKNKPKRVSDKTKSNLLVLKGKS